MKQLKNMQIIGIDNGYGNLKTASGIFPASVLTFDHEPVHAQDLLVYDGKYHVIGSGHREFTPDKVSNPDHYILTLAGIGQELWAHRMTEARVYIAAGLPLTWVESQRESFRAYLLQNDHVDFIWRGIEYHVDIVGADVYAQGFSAIVPMLRQFKGVNMLCDIGPGTGYGIVTALEPGGAWTIVEERSGWGKLKSGAGWICLKYTKPIS